VKDHDPIAIEKAHDVGFSTPPTRKGVFWTFMLLGGPSSFLVLQTARYALRDGACIYPGLRALMEVCGLAAVVIPTVISIIAWRRWRADRLEWPNDAPDAHSRDRFLAVVCLTLALFTIAAAVALWMPSAFLSPCESQ
jgi:hypothetical protein